MEFRRLGDASWQIRASNSEDTGLVEMHPVVAHERLALRWNDTWPYNGRRFPVERPNLNPCNGD